MAVAPTALEPTPFAVCDCSADHEHGTRDMYSYHRCRCPACGEANNAYYGQTAHLRWKRQWVDPEPVRQRILLLREAGLSVQQMADMCGVQTSVLFHVLHGRGGNRPKRVLASTLDALLAVRARDITAVELTDGAKVDGAVPAAQTKALHAMGWTVEDLSERSGVGIQTFYKLLRGRGTTEAMRRRIDALYRELHTIAPVAETPLQAARYKRALRRSAEHGWTPGMAEDAQYGQAA